MHRPDELRSQTEN